MTMLPLSATLVNMQKQLIKPLPGNKKPLWQSDLEKRLILIFEGLSPFPVLEAAITMLPLPMIPLTGLRSISFNPKIRPSTLTKLLHLGPGLSTIPLSNAFAQTTEGNF
jgi:hypothetical protein